MQVYIQAAPEEAQAAASLRRPLAHAAYRIGPDSTLLRRNLLLQTKGGLLSISDREAPVITNPEALCAAVLRECGRRNYQGVLLDFESSATPDRAAFVRRLGEVLSAGRRSLYVPEAYAAASPQASVLVCAAVSGGGFADHLRESARRFGSGKLALDMECLRMDFSLPALSGMGEPLTAQRLEALLAQESPAVFFSQELCARYFTYLREGESHFVLFDDADTLRQKLRTGTALGYTAAFFVWPEIQSLAGALFPGSS